MSAAGRRWQRALASGLALWISPATALADLPRPVELKSEVKLGRPGEPGSGVEGEARPSQDRARLKTPLPRRPRGPDESEGMDEIERLYGRYRAASNAAAHTLRDRLLVEAQRGRTELQKSYDQEIAEHRARSRKLRAKAVARYEAFLSQHPDNPTWTPEIAFRLAELQFQAASERYFRQSDAWEEQVAATEEARARGEEVEEIPPPPTPEYAESVALFRDIGMRFPRYAHRDAALYMMGVLLYEQERFDASRQAFLALACSNRYSVPEDDEDLFRGPAFRNGDYRDCQPAVEDSKYVAEAWLRTGELHYDLDELQPALEAYEAAMGEKGSRFYAAALIRKAWTLYLMRDFEKAARKLDEYVLYVDSPERGKEETGTEFRGDAIRYIAKAYLEEDWNGDGRIDRQWGPRRLDRDYAKRGKEPHVPEIYTALGELLAFQTDFSEAIAMWEDILRRWPNTPTAPEIQLKILQGYQMLQDEASARSARDKLATNYLRGTKWFYANENNPDALEKALDLAQDALVATAVDHHARAQEMRAAGDPRALAEYQIAARAYAAYLERFPATAKSYEYRYQYAESLYWSKDYRKAAEVFAEVRDSPLDNRFQVDAADGVVSALEEELLLEEAKGYALPPMPKDGAEGPFDPKEMPELLAELQGAIDSRVSVRSDDEEAPKLLFRAASFSQRYHRFDESEERFVEILERHCSDNVAINAGYAIIDAHVVQGDLEGTREWTEKLMEMGCGAGDESARFAGELKTIGNAVRFQEATLLYEAGEYEAAADRYVALVDGTPDDPYADRALNNAAVAYEQIGRFGTASRTYERIYTEYADSEFADDALLRTGLNHARFFEFDVAVKSYLVLAEDPRYEDSEFRLVALKNAASLLDNLQQYNRSADLFRETSRKADEPNDKADALFRAAEVVAKTGDLRATIRAYRDFLRAWESVPEQSARSVQAYLEIGKAYEEMKDRKNARKSLRRCIELFAQRGLPMASDAADYPAEAQFRLAEYELEEVLRVKVTGQGRALEKSIAKLFDKVIVTAAEYDAVFPYRRIEWTLAGMYRRGYAFENVATKVREAPVPKQLKEYSEPWFAYKDIVDAEMQRFEDKATVLYEETVKRAREYAVSNEWTQRARERLNLYKPDEYPLLREPALALQLEDRRP